MIYSLKSFMRRYISIFPDDLLDTLMIDIGAGDE